MNELNQAAKHDLAVLGRRLALGVGLWVALSLTQVWGGNGSFMYDEAKWDGRHFIPTGRVIEVCDWRCYLGIGRH